MAPTVPIRWQVILLLHTGLAIEYSLRVNTSVAVVQMADIFKWSRDQQGYLLSAFYWGYALGQIPSVLLTKYMYAKNMFAGSITLACLLTMLLPWAASHSFFAAVAVRVLIGVAESAAFPAAFHLYKFWVPSSEKTIMITCVMSGIYLGEILCFALSGLLANESIDVAGKELGEWRAIFWVVGLIGLCWVPIWLCRVRERPEDDTRVSPDEMELLTRETSEGRAGIDSSRFQYKYLLSSFTDDELENELELSNFTPQHKSDSDGSESHEPSGHKLSGSQNTPWAAFLAHPSSVALIVCYWTQNWIGFLVLSELPTYLTEELGYSLRSAGLLSTAPYIAQFVSTGLFGVVFQKLQDAGILTVQSVRQVAMHVCFMGSTVCLIACGYVSDADTAVILIVLTLFFYGACQSGAACNFLEISPIFSAQLNTLANLFAALSGVASPIAVSTFRDAFPGITGWRVVFIVTGLQCFLSSVIWFFYQTCDVVPILNTPNESMADILKSRRVCRKWITCNIKEDDGEVARP